MHIKTGSGCRFDLQIHAKTIVSNIFSSEEYKYLQASYGIEKSAKSDQVIVPVVASVSERKEVSNKVHPMAVPDDETNNIQILVAEDSDICIKVMRTQIAALNLTARTNFLISGD